MMQRYLGRMSLIGAIAVGLVLEACSPVPRHTLNNEEKTADMLWIYSQFRENYAPLEFKEKKYGFDFETLKANYLKEAIDPKTKTNDDFYSLMYRFVAEFHDAHTAASLLNSDLPGRAQVSVLGFGGTRMGDNLAVTSLLPTFNVIGTSYPIVPGDIITKVDGVALKDLVLNEFVKYRNLGQDESNLTYHMNRIFNRISTANGTPCSDNAVLTVNRGGKEVQVTLPWVKQDLITFLTEQRNAAAAQSSKTKTATASIFDSAAQVLASNSYFLPMLLKTITPNTPDFHPLRTFTFVDTIPTWSDGAVRAGLSEAVQALKLSDDSNLVQSSMDDLQSNRNVPDGALFIPDAKTYPTYITYEKVLDKDGKETGASKFVAYMYLNTFAPGGDEDTVVAEVQKTLLTLKKNGVNDLIIDLINNGGGSLSLGARIAQALSKESINQPGIQLRVSDTWLDEMNRGRAGGAGYEREFADHVYNALTDAETKGLRLTPRINLTDLMPSLLNSPNLDLDSNFHVVLMTNEMCASMCDIFTGILRDNKMATIVGAKTMGAGGNVVEHGQAPNSHLILNQTESLIVRSNAENAYIENQGIEPDIALPVNQDALEKYDAIRHAALAVLTTAQ